MFLAVLFALMGYVCFDIADLAPGVLTAKPLPPPAPTATTGKRTLPVVEQPSAVASTPVLPSLATGDAPTSAGIQAVLAKPLTLPALRNVTYVVADGRTGEVLAANGADKPRTPASTTKLLTALAISRVFSPGESLQTKVVLGSEPNTIVLVAGGDTLLAKGKGDPDAVAGRAGLGDLATQVSRALKAKGMTNVTVLVDTSYAPGPLTNSAWPSDYRASGISSAVATLGLADQRALPGRPGPADPIKATQAAFITELHTQGITATPGDQIAVAPAVDKQQLLGVVVSAPVTAQLALALTDSDNGLTESLARQAAWRSAKARDFPTVGDFIMRESAAAGIPMSGVKLYDASGLNPANRIPASGLSAALALGYSGKDPSFTEALIGMPVAGLTGTLADRFLAPGTHVVAGRAQAKTGTLTGVNTLAGWVVDDDGSLITFVVMVDGAGTLEARSALDQFVAALGPCGCRQ